MAVEPIAPSAAESAPQGAGLLLARLIGRASSRMVGSVVLAVGVVLSLLVWQATTTARQESAFLRFSNEVDRENLTLQRRLIGLEQVLRGGAGLFDVNNGVSRSQWNTYITSLHLEDNFTGVLGVGFSLRIPADRRQGTEEHIRADGFPEFAIRPPTPRDEYHAIIYLEPFSGRNLRAFGFDMYTEAVRRTALNRAWATGQAALSGRVELVQETKQDVQAGFLLYFPVYRTGLPRATPEQRHEALLGFVYMPLRARDLLAPLLNQYATDVGTEVFDGENIRPESLLYSNRASAPEARPLLEKVSHIQVAGHTWTLRHTSQPAFASAIGDGKAVLFIGLLLSAMLSGAVWSLAWTRNRATSLAHGMTRELSRSESRLKTILETAPDAVITLDAEGVVATVNRAAERMFGRPAEDMPGSHVSSLIPELYGALALRRLQEKGLMQGDSLVAGFESEARHARGHQFPISISLGEFDDLGHRHLSMVVRDISESRRAAGDLMLRDRALESSSNGVVIADLSLPDQPIIYCNPAFEHITGYHREEVLGHNCRFLQGNETEQEALGTIRDSVATGRPCTVVLRNYRKDGTVFWNELSIAPVLDTQGRASHFVGVQNDITERVQAEMKLLLRQQRLDAVFSLSPDGFVGFDEHGELSLFNPAFTHMTGLGEEDLTGLTEREFDSLMHGMADPALAYPAVVAETPSCGLRTSCDTCDEKDLGSHCHIATLHLRRPTPRILQRSVRTGSKKLGEKVYYFRDVTHETEVDRMKSEFLSTAAHELRTPMASIYGFSELLLTRDFDEATRRDMANTIHRQAGSCGPVSSPWNRLTATVLPLPSTPP